MGTCRFVCGFADLRSDRHLPSGCSGCWHFSASISLALRVLYHGVRSMARISCFEYWEFWGSGVLGFWSMLAYLGSAMG